MVISPRSTRSLMTGLCPLLSGQVRRNGLVGEDAADRGANAVVRQKQDQFRGSRPSELDPSVDIHAAFPASRIRMFVQQSSAAADTSLNGRVDDKSGMAALLRLVATPSKTKPEGQLSAVDRYITAIRIRKFVLSTTLRSRSTQ